MWIFYTCWEFLIRNMRIDIRGVGNIDVNPEYIRNIPIPYVSQEQQIPIIELVDKILAAKKENPAADTIAWEQEIDRLVYELYGVKNDKTDTK